MEVVLGVMWLVIIPAAYFLPTIISGTCRHRHAGAVFVLNLFLGWTFLGWVIALIWSVMNQRDSRQARTIISEPAPTPRDSAPVMYRHDKIARVDGVSRF
jgi:Superinfection immunity protein